MKNHLINFDTYEWVRPMVGVQYKAFINGNTKIRIVEFSEGLVEPDWCKKGHSGFILDGECSINFNGAIEYFKKGDIFHIPTSEEDKHMVIMNAGALVKILLFEQI